jgi:hypothetical protein
VTGSTARSVLLQYGRGLPAPPIVHPWRTCGCASGPIGPNVREFCRALFGGGKKRFDFALLAAGYDASGKGARVVLGGRSLGRKLGRQLLVDGNIVESAEAIL